MEELNQAKEIIAESQNILIIFPKTPDFDQLGTAVSLFYTLKKSGKLVNHLPKTLPANYPLLFQKYSLPKSFVITIKGREVSELYYEKQSQLLKIFLTLKNGDISKDNLKIAPKEETSQEPDLVVTLGLQNLEQLGQFYEKNFKLFYQTSILNIDNQTANSRFGKINLIAKKQPLCLVLKQLFVLANYKLDNQVRLWLLAGIIGYLEKNNSSLESRHLINIFDLLGPEIDYQKLIAVFCQEENNQSQLLERAFRKIELLKDRDLPVITLKKEHFEQTQTRPKDLGFVLLKLIKQGLRFPRLLLLWESFSNPYVQAVFYSNQEELNQKIKANFNAEQRGKGLIFDTKKRGLEEAKKQVVEAMSI